MINIRAFLVTRSSYWYQDICPCDLGHLLNWPLLGAFVFHKHILLFRGTGKDLTASVFETSIWIPSFVKTRPRYFIEVRANAHLLGLSVNPAYVSLEKICSKYCSGSWKEFEKTRMSSTSVWIKFVPSVEDVLERSLRKQGCHPHTGDKFSSLIREGPKPLMLENWLGHSQVQMACVSIRKLQWGWQRQICV